MGLFDKLFGEKIPKYKKYRIEIAEALLGQIMLKEHVENYNPLIVEFMTKLDFDGLDMLLQAIIHKGIGATLKNHLSATYIDSIFIPIVEKALITTDERELNQLLKDIESKKIYEELRCQTQL